MTDEGQTRMKKFLSAMSEGTPWVSDLQDVKTYGLPNIVMNSTIEETWSYRSWLYEGADLDS